jgi:hypothetical protein
VWCNLYDLCETLNDAAADKITTINVPQDFDLILDHQIYQASLEILVMHRYAAI